MALLAGIHDRQGAHILPPGAWCLDTIALSENPPYTDYAHLMPGINWIVRVNWGYGSTGTLPPDNQYADFADRVAAYVAHSSGCSRWIIGNETNLPREWPNNRPIYPWDYAECYLRCRAAIRALPGHERDEVLIAGPGPWNNELKYTGNPNGDWVQYFVDVFEAVGGNCDGFSLHAYTHGYDPALVTSEKRMDHPFENRHYEFRTYKDYLAAVPFQLRELPVYITEANGNGPWEARGLMPAMLREISEHNESGGQPISCLIFYRYPRYDEFHMEGKPDVIAEFQQAAQRQWAVPVPFVPANQPQEQTYMPQASTGISAPTLPERQISEDFKQRVPQFTPHAEVPGRKVYRLVKAEYVPDGAARFGPDHHILVNVLDVNGNRAFGVPVNFYWADGETIVPVNKTHGPYGADYGMTSAGHSFGVWVGDSHEASDNVFGMGLGKLGSEHMGDHVSYYLVFQEVEGKPMSQPQPSQVPPLTHPIEDPAKRIIRPCQGVITQRWGENPQNYARFGQPGHNGLDIANSAGTPIKAVADGVVAFVGTDVDYGNYVRVSHPQLGFDSFYAHLLGTHASARVGNSVKQGQEIGAMGTTGNSTGNHLHLEFRLSNGNSYVELSGGYGKGRFDPEIAYHLLNRTAITQPASNDLRAVVKAAAIEFGIDPELFDRLVQYESSYRPDVVSSAGAIGLAQLMPGTFNEHGPWIGATNIYNPKDNARTGAAYLKFLIGYYKGNAEKAVTAYNMGPGSVDRGVQPSLATKLYVAKVVHNRDGVDA